MPSCRLPGGRIIADLQLQGPGDETKGPVSVRTKDVCCMPLTLLSFNSCIMHAGRQRQAGATHMAGSPAVADDCACCAGRARSHPNSTPM